MEDPVWTWAYRATDPAESQPGKSGKWMLFPRSETAGKVWRIVATATQQGLLGPQSKITANPKPGKQVLVAVCTKDYTDLDDVRRVLNQLRELGFTDRMSYKEDNATRYGLYQDTTAGTGERAAALYVSQPDSIDFDQRRDPMPDLFDFTYDFDVDEENPPAYLIRIWANANGHHVSNKGRIPKRVVEAWRQAHQHTK